MTLAYFAAAWFAGTVAAAIGWDRPVAAICAVLALASAALAALLRRRPGLALIGLLSVALFSGAYAHFDGADSPETASGIAALNDGGPVTFRALVVDEPDRSGRYVSTRVDVKEVLGEDSAWQASSGGVLLREEAGVERNYGDLLTITARLETPPVLPNFDYRQYLARQGTTSIVYYPDVSERTAGQGNAVWSGVHHLRRDLSSALASALPEPHASLAQGILLGERRALPQDLKDDLNATSTSHIIALSGYNITLLAGLVIGAFAWLIGRRRAALLALATIVVYTVFTGASPSLVRAAIMGSLYLTATLVGRPNSGLVSVLIAAALMTGIQPDVVRDVSFQLSFAATTGVIVLAPLIKARIEGMSAHVEWLPAPPRRGPASALYEIGVVTVAAVFATMPLIALYFRLISVIAVPANLLVLPSLPYIMIASTFVAIIGLVSAPAAHIAGYFAWLGLEYMIALVRLLTALPFASFEVRRFNVELCVASYLLLAVLCWLLATRRPGEAALRRFWQPVSRVLSVPARPINLVPAPWLAGGLILPAIVVWLTVFSSADGRLTSVFAAPTGRLSVEVFDVGEGDAILIRTPDGQKLLIDGGPDGEAIERELGEALPFWDKKLDLVLLTHPDADHLTGLLTILERYNVERAAAPSFQSNTILTGAWQEIIDDKGIPQDEVWSGASVNLGEGAWLRVLGPPANALSHTGSDDNNNSLVVMIEWGSVRFLLTGDLEADGEQSLLDARVNLSAAVLKVAHHGSAHSTTPGLLAAVRPAVSVISVGENDFGHPAPSTLSRLDGTIVYRTDQQGDVTFSTDGERLWINAERGQPPLPSRFSTGE